MTSSVSTVASAPVSFYKSDLEVMTAFVKDRSKFLDTVVDAITYEATDDAAKNMVSLLENSAFLQFMPVLLADNDSELCTKALLALGNLIASDNHKVAYGAFKVAVAYYDAIRACAYDSSTEGDGAYVLYSMALCSETFSIGGVDVIDLIVNDAKALIKSNNNRVARDMLYVLQKFGNYNDVSTIDLLYFINSSNKHAQHAALDILGEQVSMEDFDTTYVNAVYDSLRALVLDNSFGVSARRTLAWAFSNLVTENGMADRFFKDTELYDAIIEDMLHDYDSRISSESAWIIGNAIVNAALGSLTTTFLKFLRAKLTNYVNSRYVYDSTKTAVNKSLTVLKDAIDSREVVAAPMTPTERTDMEIDEDASWVIDDKPIPHIESNMPCEISMFTPPTALELLTKGFVPKTTSKVVYDLIRSVEANSLNYTPVPKDTLLTVDDLMALEERGFSILNGYVGISTRILYSYYYNN